MNWGEGHKHSFYSSYSVFFPEFLTNKIFKNLILLKPQGLCVIVVTSEAIILIVSQKLITKKWTVLFLSCSLKMLLYLPFF